mmetsp:Transcript_15373/g.18338  ORF Transcript_15373/g.18338 Transcript_15373/m.18338 type:complete len:92 (+) Transcript_15373:2334-2609(+)
MSPFTKVYQNQSQSGGGLRQTGNSQKQRSGKILTGSGMGRGLVGSQKRPVGSSHGPEVNSGVQVVRGSQPSGYKPVHSQNNRNSLRSHSPG